MLDVDIYVKTDAGRDEIKSRSRGLPMSVRAILVMIDGQRTVGAVRAIVDGSKAPADTLQTLEAQGLIEPRGGPSTASPTLRTPVAAAAPIGAPAATTATTRSPKPMSAPSSSAAVADVIDDETSDTQLRSFAVTQDLDLLLPTIFSPEVSSVPTPWTTATNVGAATVNAPAAAATSATSSASAVAPPAAPVVDRYEHLYTMINEVVRDFLPAHRRLFLQLKIERCSTAEDLLEILHDVRNALAKSRGDAFASDVVARLRNAA